MKIIVLGLRGFPNIQGGVETHCEHLLTRIAAKGHEVIVFGRKPYMGAVVTQYNGVQLIPLACPKKKSLEAFVHTLIGLFKARIIGADIVHIHAIGPSLFVPLARILGMTVVSTNHGPDYERAKWGKLAKIILRLGESMGSRFSHAVIAISDPIAAHLRTSFRCKPEVIPNGVVPRLPSIQQEILSQYGLNSGRYLLAVGRLVPEKGFHDLIDAFIKASVPGWKLVIAGRADHEDAYSIGLKEKADVTPNVIMTGFITGEPLSQLYSHAGLFVLPSYHEGLPIVLLEAMGYGLSVIASDIPANRQAGLHDERFFTPGNINETSQKIILFTQKIFTSEEKEKQISYITKNFNWDLIAKKTIDIYKKLKNN